MTLQQQAACAVDQGFQDRCRLAVYKGATDIVGEDTSSMSAEKASKRYLLGMKVLAGGPNILTVFYRAVATQVGDVADPATIVDGDINTAVSAVWDDIAGVKYGE
jgi:hypothetical protein